MEIAERDRAAYAMAREYLLGFSSVGVTEEVLDHYINPQVAALRPHTLADVYRRLLESAQNRGMSVGVIGGAIGGVEALKGILCGFEPGDVVRKYGDDWNRVLDEIETELHPRGEVRRAPRSLWPLFCRTITTGAGFLSQFGDADTFCEWVERFDGDARSRPTLPLLLSLEIEGFGFPLACDFLKELGYLNFPKPDVHLKTIFTGLHLVESGGGDYAIFKAAGRIAEHQGVMPYNVDKLFWLVGSGYFYDHPDVGDNCRIGTDRKQFIAQASRALGGESAS